MYMHQEGPQHDSESLHQLRRSTQPNRSQYLATMPDPSDVMRYEWRNARRLEIIKMTEAVIEAIGTGDYETYRKLCDPNMTSFEPETLGNLIEGVDYHKFTFDNLYPKQKAIKIRILNPHVRLLGDNAASIAYIRLTQFVDGDTGYLFSTRTQETRIWRKKENVWYNVHVHRSGNELIRKSII
nr:calcium/calmodulin-dependent protein kinase type II alpha chain-like [Onthophagus taurus]